jgi:hypothetical protein
LGRGRNGDETVKRKQPQEVSDNYSEAGSRQYLRIDAGGYNEEATQRLLGQRKGPNRFKELRGHLEKQTRNRSRIVSAFDKQEWLELMAFLSPGKNLTSVV